MSEEGICQVGQPNPRVGIVDADRFVRQVARRQHQHSWRHRIGTRNLGEQQVVQRAVRQHHAQQRVARCHECRDVRARASAQQHDRPGRRLQCGGFLIADLRQCSSRGQRRHHHRERLVRATLAGTQRAECVVRSGVDREVVAAETLDGDDRPGGNGPLCRGDDGIGSVDDRPLSVEPHLRPADGARRGLRVIPAVRRVVVFAMARRTHHELRHCRGGPVVRKVGDDGEAGTAVGAVRERIPIAPVGRVEHLDHAVVARGDIGGHRGAVAADRRRLHDREAIRPSGRNRCSDHRIDTREGWGITVESLHERRDR